jgi:hypothetical protein
MAHYLQIDVELSREREPISLRVDFEGDLGVQIEPILHQISTLPARWTITHYRTDVSGLAWSERGSRDRLAAVVSGCQEHGWPFVCFAHARSDEDLSTTWSSDYANKYLGWWPSKNAFAQEIASSGAHFMEDAADLNPASVDEICSGFLCLDVDGQILVFDLMV